MTTKSKLEHELIWQEILPIIRARMAQSSVRGADGDDMVTEFQFFVWGVITSGTINFNSADHAKAYFIRSFKNRLVDAHRRRQSRAQRDTDYAVFFDRYTPSGVMAHMYMVDLLDSATHLSDGHLRVLKLIMDGHTYREIADIVPLSKASIQRMFKDVVRHALTSERVSCGEASEGQTEMKKGTGMGWSYTFAKGVVSVMEGKGLVAEATLDNDLDIVGLRLKRKGLDQDALLDGVREYVAANVTKEQVAEVDAASEVIIPPKKEGASTMATDKTVKKAAPAAKAKAKKAVAPDLPAKPALDLTKLKDVPATLADWQKKVGGKGYCLGGSGLPVASRFKPGYDAKLKGILKRLGTPNAKALAKELGWFDMIKWVE